MTRQTAKQIILTKFAAVLKTPAYWSLVYRVHFGSIEGWKLHHVTADPKPWDEPKPWNEPITNTEFKVRASRSETYFVGHLAHIERNYTHRATLE